MNKAAGFTLIELVVVVAIVGILSSIAFNSYQESVAKGRRAEAMSALMESAQALERFYSANGTYLASNGTALGSTLTSTAYYTIEKSGDPTATTFKLQATRISTKGMKSDKCGNFTIDQAGTRDVANATKTKAECWRN